MTEPLNPLTLPAPADAEEWLDSRARGDLDRARELVAGIKADRPADATDLLNRWNDVSVAIGNVASVASLFSEVHPLETVRSRGESAMQEVQKLDTDLSLDRDLYEVFAAVDGSGLDATAKRLLDKTLLDFHRGGVDKDDATRARVKELSERAILVGQEFSKNIRDDVRTVKVTPDKLAGMPQDWIDAHVVDEDGLVTADHRLPRRRAVLDLRAATATTRRALRMEFLNRAWPANDALLKELFELRREHAHLLGYRDWADYDAEVKMIKEGAGDPGVHRPDRRRRARVRAARPRTWSSTGCGRTSPTPRRSTRPTWRTTPRPSAREQLRRRRPAGAHLLRLHRGAPRPARGDRPAVRADLRAGRGRRALGRGRSRRTTCSSPTATGTLGRIYLDLHPREGKYKHAAQFDLVRRPRRTASSPRACSSATSRAA